MPPLAQQWAAHTSERHPVAQRLQRAALQAELEARAKGELHPVALELRRASALAEALDAVSRGEDVSAFIELTSHADLLVPCWLAWRRRAASRRHLHEAHVPAVLTAWRIWARTKRAARPEATEQSLSEALALRHRARRLLLTWRKETKLLQRENAAKGLNDAHRRRQRRDKHGVGDEDDELAVSIRKDAESKLAQREAQQRMERQLAASAQHQAEYEAASLIQAHIRRKLQGKKFELMRVNPFERVRRVTKTLLHGNDAFQKLRAATVAVMGQTRMAEERSRRLEVANMEALTHLQEARARLVHVEAMHVGAGRTFARQVGKMYVHDSWFGECRGDALARPPLAQLDASDNDGGRGRLASRAADVAALSEQKSAMHSSAGDGAAFHVSFHAARRMFEKADSDGDGAASFDELLDSVVEAEVNVQASVLLAQFDRRAYGRGVITLEDFAAICTELSLTCGGVDGGGVIMDVKVPKRKGKGKLSKAASRRK
ncbi:EF-hand domain-containing protein [Pycnococcus provasolii]